MWHEYVFGWPLTPKYVAGTLGWSVQSLGLEPNLSDSKQANAMTRGHGISDTRAPCRVIWPSTASVPRSWNPHKYDLYSVELK
jgi:hypothetical protein